MEPRHIDEVAPLLTRLLKLTQAWALRRDFHPDQVASLREQVLLRNHNHYMKNIPAYRRFVQEEGFGQIEDIQTIRQNLMISDDFFKSYNQAWLDENSFDQMNHWLSQIFHRRVEFDTSPVDSIDAWIDHLEQEGIRVVYSSGTSGNFSFVPRDLESWNFFVSASSSYIIPLMMFEKVGTPWQRLLVRGASKIFGTLNFTALVDRFRTGSGFDAIFLDFRQGRTGNQMLSRQLAPFFRRHTFLYETDLSPTTVRLISRGVKSEVDQVQLSKLEEVVIDKKEDNYVKLIKSMQKSSLDGQKVFIFGTTHQYKELCELIIERNEAVSLLDGSLVLFGGGWKSFTGERISREELLSLISKALGLPAERIMEGYSMTEINAFMLRCDHGRFHIPPFIEPVIMDEDLSLLDGDDIRGIFAFLDPLALAYPGFIISGDEVRFVNGECPCGLVGPAVTEIGRAQSREIKGCGGIVTSVAA